MKKLLPIFCALLAVLGSTQAFGQGVTSSSMAGQVLDLNGEALTGATVQAIHTPTGTQYGAVANIDGRFSIRNMRVGGPYVVKVSFVGYKTQEIKGLTLQLGETLSLDFVLLDDSQELQGVTVTGDAEGERTGAATALGQDAINGLPTIKRSASDYTRLTPQSNGNSFGGRNNLYNNFSLDGSIFNNSFGLDVATPGGQTDSQPVSLDAIEQIQVSIAPFDVRQGGFTGAGVNAVTRSGTNKVQGSAYTFFRNQSMVGQKVGDIEVPALDFSTSQSGFRIGGPIIKDKVFFFINGEAERRTELAHGFVADGSPNSGSSTTVDYNEILSVQQHLMDVYGFDPGPFEGYNHQTFNNKLLAKVDWNISQNHDFALRFNYLDSWKDILPHPEAIGGRGPTPFRLPFANSSYRIHNDITSVVGELNSRYANASNRLLVGYTAFRDFRESWALMNQGSYFPTIDIWDNFDGVTHITAGSEMFSTGNLLSQDVFQLTNDFTFFMGSHTVTAGLNYEQFNFDNSFNLFFYPWVTYGSVDDFLADSPLFAVGAGPTEDVSALNALVTSRANSEFALSEVNVGQLGLYVQDEWQATKQLRLTLGLRADMPLYLSSSIVADPVVEAFDDWVDENGDPATVDPTQFPNATPLISPRLGFNYDAKGDRTLVLRGGSGIFTGRVPFVWLGNQASNSFLNEGFSTFQLNATTQDFRFPQAWKNNLAIDINTEGGWSYGIETIFSKDLNAVVHRNYTMAPPSGQLSGTGDNRALFVGTEANIYNNDTYPGSGIDAGAIILDNTRQGYQFMVTGTVGKTFDFGMNANVSYTYLDSKDLTSIPAEIAADAFQRNPVVGNPNLPQFSWSRYGLQHRIVGSLNYRREYGSMATTIGAFYEVAQGGRYSFVYAGDVNGDFIPFNDLIYVPENAGDINFGAVDAGGGLEVDGSGNGVTAADAADQWSALDAFINQDPYLSTRRGTYAGRNGATLPWFGQVDLRVLQDFKLETGNTTHRLQVSFDILNAGNLLNSNWGVRYLPTTTTPLEVVGVDASNVPYFRFNDNATQSYTEDVSIASKWQAQLGLRYIFN